jgi:hypothetical protein
MDQPDFTIKNLNVSHGPVLDSKGAQVIGKKVTFSVGEHGPFYLNYPDVNTPTTTIKSDIQAQVAELQSLHQLTA